MYPSPLYVECVDQCIDCIPGIVAGLGGEMSVARGGQNADMAHNLLQLNKVDPGFQHMGGIAVAQGVA